jgi:hypothetical protein
VPDVNLTANYTSQWPVIPIANNTRSDCYQYVYFDNLTDNGAADCWALAMIYDITGEEMVLWNPSLANSSDLSFTTNSAALSATASSIASAAAANATATASTTSNAFGYPCTLAANTSYCVMLMSPTASAAAITSAPPSPRAAGEIVNCTEWYAPQSYDTCGGILNVFGLTIAKFFAMNPGVKSDCTGMNLGTYYCISTNPGGGPGSAAFSDISASLGFTGNATGTGKGTYPTSTGSGIVTPTPTQNGMVSHCTKFYDVATGDGKFVVKL